MWAVLDNHDHDLLVSSMQRLNSCALAANGADVIPAVIGRNFTGDESISVTVGTRSNSDERRDESTVKKFIELSTTIKDYGNKIVSATKMKCIQREKDHNNAMHAETSQSQCRKEADDYSDASGKG